MKRDLKVHDSWSAVGSDSEERASRAKPLSFIPMLGRGGDSLKQLAANAARYPDDAGAFERLGIAYANAGEHRRAAEALGEAVAIDPQRSRAWSALGEARTRAADTNAPLPHAARQAFERALAIDAEDVRAQFYLALDKDVQGARKEAIDDWLGLLRAVPLGSTPDKTIRAAILESLKREMTTGD